MPWRFSFDRSTAELIVADVGDERFEEVDLQGAAEAGANLGWPFYEGRHRHDSDGPAGITFPVLAKSHANGFCAIVGGDLVRRLPALRGRYLYGDVCTGRLYSARLRHPRVRADRSEHLAVPALVSFGTDARQRIYAVSIAGAVYRISG
jgi:hypothetical protein